jgi:hypothetical protein
MIDIQSKDQLFVLSINQFNAIDEAKLTQTINDTGNTC